MTPTELISKYGFFLVKLNGADAIKPASVPMSLKAKFESEFEKDRPDIMASKEEIKQILRNRAKILEESKKEAKRVAALDIDDQEFWDRRSKELDELKGKKIRTRDIQKEKGWTDEEYWEYLNRL